MRRVPISVLLSALILAVQGYAQNITGSISGRVVDPSGAAIPDATVQANDSVRNTTVKTITTPQGEFSLAGLQPGTYTISVTAAGFKKLDDPNIALDAQNHLALGNLTLQIGAVSESIEVSAESALLQTESAERSQAIIGKQMTNIEVNGRNPIDMAKLIPGVVSTANVSMANS